MKALTNLTLILIIFGSSAFLMSCEKKGPAEEAGEKIDDTVEDIKDNIEDAGN